MLIAQEKKKENLAEYILYMWQVEDFIRACKFDMNCIEKQRVNPFDVSGDLKKQIYDWYENLLIMMQKEKIQKKGHLQILKNNVDELTELHFALLHKKHDPQYRQLFTSAAQTLLEMRQNSKADDETSDIEIALTTLYGVLLLRLSGKGVSKETMQGIHPLSRLLAYLSKAYKEVEEELSKK
ncbi:uncharacterized protein DUF4924 [Balneicella halophila]|uniref:Uncharacterized protein DUF4924 n=1 Tax=Balneicella halophila TaxID=1537566 RepID=A0A7L4URB3_BALHA|nr:DUF4924 family protein [Balneicella halophila]PVX51981.1 uncharacterized protein DUF4924 [Balneicella halophila]